ncbi:hypothetical protein Pcinc_002295 [Petrolisthes cinctipes]|uniref:Uncharacterized protein n=1 Tax=Petrolisthes cinctipes TaxID=88211 RepID=A0AAE1L2C9_PETCI|nr:hypothetical protein Pcinc_002295 [Petrolisthes cinctipes]
MVKMWCRGLVAFGALPTLTTLITINTVTFVLSHHAPVIAIGSMYVIVEGQKFSIRVTLAWVGMMKTGLKQINIPDCNKDLFIKLIPGCR